MKYKKNKSNLKELVIEKAVQRYYKKKVFKIEIVQKIKTQKIKRRIFPKLKYNIYIKIK